MSVLLTGSAYRQRETDGTLEASWSLCNILSSTCSGLISLLIQDSLHYSLIVFPLMVLIRSRS